MSTHKHNDDLPDEPPEWFVNLTDRQREVLLDAMDRMATYRAKKLAERRARKLGLANSATIHAFPRPGQT